MKVNYVIALVLMFSFLISYNSINAQSSKKEVGVLTSDLSSFGFSYKKERKENKYLVLSIPSLAFSHNDGFFSTSNFLFNATIAWEKRVSIDDNLLFAHGFSPGFSHSRSISHSGDSNVFFSNTGIELGYDFGLQYHFSDDLYFQMKTRPYIGWIISGRSDRSDDFSFGLSASNRVSIGVFYKIGKKGE